MSSAIIEHHNQHTSFNSRYIFADIRRTGSFASQRTYIQHFGWIIHDNDDGPPTHKHQTFLQRRTTSARPLACQPSRHRQPDVSQTAHRHSYVSALGTFTEQKISLLSLLVVWPWSLRLRNWIQELAAICTISLRCRRPPLVVSVILLCPSVQSMSLYARSNVHLESSCFSSR